MASNTDEAGKAYYPPYVSPPPQNDGYSGLGAGNGSGYDLLSYSGSAHLSGPGSAQVDHPQHMSSDSGYKSKWGFVWSGLNDREHGNWMDYGQGFVSKDLNTSNLSNNRSSLFVDGSSQSRPFVDINTYPFVDGTNKNHLFGDVSNKSHLKQGACVTQDLDLHGQVSSAKDSCFDIFGGAYSLGSLGVEQQDCKPSSECSRTRTSASVFVSKEIPHLQEPVLESVTSFCGSQKANGSLPEDHFSQAGFYRFNCASTTSTFPVTITKLPYGGSSSLVESTPSAVKLNSVGIDVANQCNTAAGYTSSNEMEPQMPLGLKRPSSIRIRRPAPSSTAASSCQIGETANCRLDEKDAFEKTNIPPELPYHLSSHGVNMEASHAEAVYTVDKYSGGSDVHNPAEDSPCWKGASSNNFSPFECSESVVSDVLVKEIDRCRSLSSQDLQNKSLLFKASDSKNLSFGKVNEATYLERLAVSDYTSNDDEYCGPVNTFCRFDLNTADGLQFADNSHALGAECNMINKPKACLNSKNSLAADLMFKGESSSAEITLEAPPSENIGKASPVAAESLSGSPSIIGNNLSNPLAGNKASLESVNEVSDSRISANVLLRTMMNLSEIFRCYCFSNRTEVAEKQSVAIKQIINNLNASMVMMTEQTIPTSVLSTPDNLLWKDFPAVQMVNDAEALATSVKLGRTTEDSFDYVSFEDDRNPCGDANMTEAVKKLLSENLQEEEMDQQRHLYKNLWLEAEASLCLMTAKARFLRMESEMKRTYDGIKGDNPTSSNVSVHLHGTVESATEDKDCSSLGKYLKPTTTGQHNHIELLCVPNSQVESSYISDSEKARLTKKETCFPSFFASSPSAFGNDFKLATENIGSHRVVELATEDKESSSLGECPNPATASQHDNIEVSHLPNSHTMSFPLPEAERSKPTNDVETCVMARYQILKNRVGCSDTLQFAGEHKCPASLYDSGNESHASSTMTKLNDLESGSVFGGYQMLKCRDDSFGHLNSEDQQLPGDENYLPDNGSSIPGKAFQDSQMSNSLGVTDEREASVMSRFRIIQSRMDQSNTLINDSVLGQASVVVVEDNDIKLGGSQQKPYIKKTTFGPYPELIEDEDVNIFDVGVNKQAFAPIVKSSVIFEGWYDNNDCSSSADWEHISSRDVLNQN